MDPADCRTLNEIVPTDTSPSIAKLERCLAVAAYLVVRHGDAYASTFEREVEQTRRRLGNRERAQRILATLPQNGVRSEGSA